MSHMVIYRTPDGKAAFQQVDDLPAAVAFVEKIRNEAGVENGRIYRLEQVNYRFEPYYQVRIDSGEAPTTAPSAPAAAGTGPLATGPTMTTGVGETSGGTGLGQGAGPSPTPAPAGVSVASPAEAGPAPAAAGAADEASAGDAGNGVRRGLFGR